MGVPTPQCLKTQPSRKVNTRILGVHSGKRKHVPPLIQLIYDIACIYEREGSVKLAARRGTKRSPSAKGSSLSNDRPDFRVGLGVDFRWLRVKFPLDWKSGILRA